TEIRTAADLDRGDTVTLAAAFASAVLENGSIERIVDAVTKSRLRDRARGYIAEIASRRAAALAPSLAAPVERLRLQLVVALGVEVEAYIGESHPACHAAPGPTPRNAPLYGAPGHAYVYLNYGIHCLVNVVTESHGSPAAVLIRALDPLDGIAVMQRRRARAAKGRRGIGREAALPAHSLCRGPGNLTMALGITLAENRVDLLGDRLYIEDRG